MAEERIEVGALARDVSVQVATQVANTVAAAKTNELLAASASAEASRVSAEQGRVTAEQGRVTAEQGRVAAETARATEFAGFEDEIDSKITLGSKWRDGTGSTGHSDKADNADNLIATKGLTVNDDPMSYGIVGGAQKSAVGDGNATLNKLVCVDVVKNQLRNSYNSRTVGGLTFTSNSNGTITVTGTAESTDNYTICTVFIPSGVIALFHTNYKNDLQLATGSSYPDFKQLIVTGVGVNMIVNFKAVEGTTYNDTFYVCANSLTQRYGNNDVVNAIIGTGTDAEKVARLLAFDPEILSDTTYNAGTMVPSKTAKLLSVGVNQWDEIAEVGLINTTTGENQPGGTTIRSTNLIGVIPGNTYYIKAPYIIGNYGIVVFFYDSAKNYIGYRDLYSTSVAIHNSCAFIRFQVSTIYGTTYNHDICINISDPNINGKYYPSKRTPVILPNYEGHGILKVVTDSQTGITKVVADGDELYPDGNSKKRYGAYTFTGNETWTASGQSYTCSIPEIVNYAKRPANNGTNWYERISALGLPPANANQLYTGAMTTGLGMNTSGYIVISSGDYANVANFVGKTIAFELATEEDITTSTFQSTFPVEQGGTLQFLDEDDNPIAGLQGSEIFYQKNIKAFVEALGEATDWDPERIKRLGNLSFTPEYVNIPLNPSPTGAYARAQVYNATFTIVISAALTGTANGSITFQDSEIDLSNFQTKPADYLYDMDGKKVSEAPTTADCNIASFVGRSKSGIVLWSLLHSGVNKVKIHIEEAVPLDSEGNGKIDCRASMIL